MFHFKSIAFAVALTISCAVSANAQQHDTTHRMAPGMKMPSTKKPAAAPRKKTTTTKKATATKKPIATTKSSARRDTVMAMPDTMQKHMTDTTHHGADTLQKRDTAHVMVHDTVRAQPPDTVHMHMRDTMPMPAHDTMHMQMRDTMHMQMRDTTHMQHRDTMPMAMMMEGPLGISMERMGSGTTWIPDDVILPSRHFMLGEWTVMVHGFLFGQYDTQGGPRGRDQRGSLNWAMVMVDRSVAGGRVQFRWMPSLDPATVGKCGYPLLLQSGETCNGQPLVDRQHPHDFFMELGALYEREIGSRAAVLLYAAPAGEPALGPVAFMHRPSAMDNAFAPLGHHWQDATHISFGVVTTGVYTRRVRLEGSAFNGIEPDENRWNFDPIKLNSYSGRLTVNPNRSWSFTAGYGSILEPEPGNPKALIHRVVASAMHGVRVGMDGQWATTALYGANRHDATWSSSALLESEALLDRHNTFFGRAELVQKSADDLALSAFPADQKFNVGSASLGYIRELVRGRDVTLGFGASGTVNLVPTALETTYGSRTPLGAMVFLRLRPYHSAHAQRTMAMPERGGH